MSDIRRLWICRALMKHRIWTSRVTWLVGLAALLLVTNPELRALLLLGQAVGVEVLLLFVWVQLRAVWPLLTPEAVRVGRLGKQILLCLLRYMHLVARGLLPREGLWLAAGNVGLLVRLYGRAAVLS